MAAERPSDPHAATPSPKGCYLSTLELHELDEACRPFVEAFGGHPYLVGSASSRPDFRDVDVRLILPDDEYDALFVERKGLWALLGRLGSTYLRSRTGLPVDFQVQRQTEANAKFGDLSETPRNPLGTRSLLTFAGGGDASPSPLKNVPAVKERFRDDEATFEARMRASADD